MIKTHLRRWRRTLNRRLEPRLRRIERWMMGRRPRARAYILLAPPLLAAFVGLAYAARSRQPWAWGLLALFFAYVGATSAVDARQRARSQAQPICRCRHQARVYALPPGPLRYLRTAVALAALVGAFFAVTVSAALTVFALWLAVSYWVALRSGYVGWPEIGAIPSALLHRPISTGCSVWCWIDHWLLGIKRLR